jgi:hypothetical protein
MKIKNLLTGIMAAGLMSSSAAYAAPKEVASSKLSATEIKSISEEAYIFALPLVMQYRTMYIQAIDSTSKTYTGGFGEWLHLPPARPEDISDVSPNNDTPYSWAWVDLRSEPWVMTLPKVDAKRYYTSQWDDLYGFVVDNAGSVNDGDSGVSVLLVSPDWKGELPKGVKRIIRGESDFLGTLTRTQLIDPKDLPNVEKIQKEYKLQSLSSYLGKPAPKTAPAIQWKPWKDEVKSTPAFWEYVNFIMSFTTPNPADKVILDKLASIGIGAGMPWDPASQDKAYSTAMQAGMEAALADLKKQSEHITDPSLFFRSRKDTKGDYNDRALGVFVGQFGNVKTEAVYFAVSKDAQGNLFDGSKGNYSLTFTADQIPPSKYFWSWTMYRLPQRALVENELKRYAIGSATPGLKKAKDGSITFYFQAKSPGKDKESNWLPAPKGAFWLVLRSYGPGKTILDKTYKVPPVKKVK